MKRLLFALIAMITMSAAGFAQAVPQTKTAPAKAKVVKMTPKTASAATTGKTKKDGTMDMRYKENKMAKTAPAGPTKKDGTLDKRYKQNKKQ